MLDFALPATLLSLMTTLALAWKWRLGMLRTAFVVFALALLFSQLVALLGNVIATNLMLRVGLVWVLTLAAAFGILAYRFYRDPERTVIDRDDLIVSPADGEVIYVRESRGGTLPVSTMPMVTPRPSQVGCAAKNCAAFVSRVGMYSLLFGVDAVGAGREIRPDTPSGRGSSSGSRPNGRKAARCRCLRI